MAELKTRLKLFIIEIGANPIITEKEKVSQYKPNLKKKESFTFAITSTMEKREHKKVTKIVKFFLYFY